MIRAHHCCGHMVRGASQSKLCPSIRQEQCMQGADISSKLQPVMFAVPKGFFQGRTVP